MPRKKKIENIIGIPVEEEKITSKKVIFENWQVALVKGAHYDIYKADEEEEVDYGVQVTLFFDDMTIGELEDNRAITIPFAQGFETAQEAFEWIEKCGEIFPNTLSEVWVLNEDGEIMTKWELLTDDDEDEDELEEHLN